MPLTLEEDVGTEPERILSWLTRIGEEHLNTSEPPTVIYLRFRCVRCKGLYSSVTYGWEDARFMAASMVAAATMLACPRCGGELEPILLGCVYPAKVEGRRTVVACVSSGDHIDVRLLASPLQKGEIIPKPVSLKDAHELADVIGGVLWPR